MNEQLWAATSEKDLQSIVIEQMKWKGWLCYHTFDSRRSQAGFPDLVAVKGTKIMFVEFKSEKGKVKPEQAIWLNRLTDAYGEVWLVRPSTQDAFLDNINGVLNLLCHWRNVRQEDKHESK